MKRLGHAVEVALTVGQMAREHDIKYPAAALAYYAFVSQVPLLILVLAVVSDQLVGQIQTTTPDFLTPGAQQQLSPRHWLPHRGERGRRCSRSAYLFGAGQTL